MDVGVGEVRSTVDAVSGDALLTPDVLARIVSAVVSALDNRGAQARTVSSERDIRSVLQQQQDSAGADRG